VKRRIWVAALLIVVFLTACSGSGWTRSVVLSWRDDKLELPIRARAGFAPSHKGVRTKYSFDEMVDIAAETAGDSCVNVYQNKYIAVRTEGMIFLIEKGSVDEERGRHKYHYYMYAPYQGFDGIEKEVYVPYHLLNGVCSMYHVSEEERYIFEQGEECEALGTVEEFYDFYDHIAHCEVTREGNALRVSHRDGGTLLLTFAARDGKSFVTFEALATDPW